MVTKSTCFSQHHSLPSCILRTGISSHTIYTMFLTKASSLTTALTIILTSMLVDRVSAMPALTDTINPRQETGGGYYIPTYSETTYDLAKAVKVDGTPFNDPASGKAGTNVSFFSPRSHPVPLKSPQDFLLMRRISVFNICFNRSNTQP